jgi:hypothetical protein
MTARPSPEYREPCPLRGASAHDTWTGSTSKGLAVKGPAAIRALMENAFAGKTYNPVHINRVLLMTNIRIQVDGDLATATSRYSVIDRPADNSLGVDHIGQISDELIREGGVFRLTFASAPNSP